METIQTPCLAIKSYILLASKLRLYFIQNNKLQLNCLSCEFFTNICLRRKRKQNDRTYRIINHKHYSDLLTNPITQSQKPKTCVHHKELSLINYVLYNIKLSTSKFASIITWKFMNAVFPVNRPKMLIHSRRNFFGAFVGWA